MKTLVITIPGLNKFKTWLDHKRFFVRDVVELVMGNLRATVCAWVGHSRMATVFMGYQSCARCRQQIGDTLAGVGRSDLLFVAQSAHDCPECRAFAKEMTWRDTFLTPHRIPNFDSLLTIPEQKVESKKMMEDLKRSIDERMMADAEGA